MKILMIICSVLIGLAGIAKVFGAKPLAIQFEEFGLPKIVMRIVGILEVAAAVGIQIKLLSFYASVGLALLLVGAIANHIKVKHPLSKSFPAFLIFTIAVIISFNTWDNSSELLKMIGF